MATPAPSGSSSVELKSTPPVQPLIAKPLTFQTGPADVTEIGMATILGGCSGFATKKIAKAGGLLIGVAFVSLQALSHANIIKVNWPRVEELIVGKLDADGDGKFTQNDIRVSGLRLMHNLTSDLPSAGGFAAAFVLGFRYG
ncbi:FUN14 family-domain-containing protein [Zopfochytrium polystomum]|nr:FUN14 family-domain-containing protein [Zopfochytrium polystomum]